MAVKQYDPDQISVTFAGLLIQGYADGEFVTVEQQSDNFSDVVGTDGRVSRSKTNDRRATITFSLMQTSDSNDELSQIANDDLNNPGGAGVGALYIRDRGGRSLYSANSAWISRPPDVSLDRAATARQWTLRAAQLERTDGGN